MARDLINLFVAYNYNEGKHHSRTGRYSEASGRSYCYITCPFCLARVKTFIWSLCGGGKKCDCGAIHTSMGFTYPPLPKPEKKVSK